DALSEVAGNEAGRVQPLDPDRGGLRVRVQEVDTRRRAEAGRRVTTLNQRSRELVVEVAGGRVREGLADVPVVAEVLDTVDDCRNRVAGQDQGGADVLATRDLGRGLEAAILR